MTGYFVRRFLLIIPTFIGITLLVFAITRVVPGGPIERLMTQVQLGGETGSLHRSQGGGTLSDEQMEELKRYYGFDKPMLSSYVIWLKKVLQFDLGLSTRYQDPVWQIIKERFPISIFYGLSTLVLTYAVCIPLGLAKGMYHGSTLDSWSSAVVFLGYALPSYVIGIALISLFAGYWDMFPLGGFISDNYDEFSAWGKAKDIFSHAVLPLIAYLAGSFAVTTLMMKNSLMDNLSADYMRTAAAKGLSRSESVRKHALRNSLIPVATSFGSNISLLLGGSFLIETIFNIDGIGLLGYEAIIERDYPIVMGILVISSLLYLLGNILSDICVALVDPRIRFGGGHGA
ncbi:ABC transporter permease subunit [Zhongshania aliphaticivorans]|uniref:ABC transporter permease subunit n=1 Tax=Zhongshania aliphaticivorans TaxID=1470434 RepID=UPI0012E4FDEC|nr:ABC transporter permease subunit [Zhongshania aliphaticivorans]CAA0119769.1 Inner membrane ABC transporter permease protein YejB [Zhongshania aliphaticivorans]